MDQQIAEGKNIRSNDGDNDGSINIRGDVYKVEVVLDIEDGISTWLALHRLSTTPGRLRTHKEPPRQ